MEVPSPSAGMVKSVAVKLGDKVSEGTPILTLEVDGTARRGRTGKTCCIGASSADKRAGGCSGGARSRYRRFQRRADHRGHGQARRHDQAGTAARYAGIRQSLDGGAVAARAVSLPSLKVKLGDRVSEGTVILTLVTDAASAAQAPLARPRHPRRFAAAARQRRVAGRPLRQRCRMQPSIFPTLDHRCESSRASAASICVRSRAAGRADVSCLRTL